MFDACDARTRAIVVSTPANPAGLGRLARAELRALVEFGRERGIWIVSDEVYSRLYLDGEAAPSILQVADPEDLALSVNSFSKSLGDDRLAGRLALAPVSAARRSRR